MASETRARPPQRSRVSFTGPVGQNPGRRPEPSRRASARETQEPRRTEFDLRGQRLCPADLRREQGPRCPTCPHRPSLDLNPTRSLLFDQYPDNHGIHQYVAAHLFEP